MSRGIGKTQQAILDALGPKHPSSTSELAESVGADPRQVRAAVASLEARGLVVCRRNCCVGYRENAITARYEWTEITLGGGPFRFRSDAPPKIVHTDMPIKGTFVWSLAAWEWSSDVEERCAAAGGYQLRENHRDHPDPRHPGARRRLAGRETAT